MDSERRSEAVAAGNVLLAEPDGRRASGNLAVEVDGVTKIFRKGPRSVEALRDINLVVHRGEFVALVGPSGCGKSTLLRMVAGLRGPSRGRIRVAGTPLKSPRRETGLMLQQPTLLVWRTVLQNVLLPSEVDGRPSKQDVAKAQHLIKLVGLERFSDHYPRELSGGMEQRVALARLLLKSPTLMLLDEPFGSLDEFTREKLNLELAEMVADDEVSVILVTHNVTEAIFLADRIITLAGTPGEVSGEVRVDFKRPRPASAIRSPEFQEKVAQVRGFLGLE